MRLLVELAAVLPFVLGLYLWLASDWILRFAVRKRAVRLLPYLSVVELAFVRGGERSALAIVRGALELLGESPNTDGGEPSIDHLQQRFLGERLLQRARLRQTLHLVLALLPLAGLVATSEIAPSGAGAKVLVGSLFVGLASFHFRMSHRRGAGWELSPLGREVSFIFRERYRGLDFHVSRLATLRLGPTLPIGIIVFGIMVVIGPLQSESRPKQTRPTVEVKSDRAPEVVTPLRVNRDPEVASEFWTGYPEVARRAGVEGTVRLRIVIDSEGQVADVKVLNGPGYGLNDAASDAIRKFKFKPAIKDGRPVSTTLIYKYTFVLDGAGSVVEPQDSGPRLLPSAHILWVDDALPMSPELRRPKARRESELGKQPPDFVVHILWPFYRVGDF